MMEEAAGGALIAGGAQIARGAQMTGGAPLRPREMKVMDAEGH